jgi:hypothetical protein
MEVFADRDAPHRRVPVTELGQYIRLSRAELDRARDGKSR